MRTFEVKLKEQTIGTVTAYTHLEAMRKAAKNYNNYSWLNLSVSIKNKTA
jgi:hypothetical protein